MLYFFIIFGGSVRNRNTNLVLRGTSILFISIAIVVTISSLITYSRQRNNYPAGMTIGGIPVGGLSPAEASQRLLEIYTSPVEVQYSDSLIHIEPALVGFEVQIDTMLAAADLTRTGGPFWGGFWDFLWNRDPAPVTIPLSASLEEERLRLFLQTEIAPRYDKPGAAPQPIPGSSDYTPGEPGQILDVERAVRLIENALRSPSNRVVVLSFQEASVSRPTFESLETQLKQIIQVSDFDGLVGLYMMDLQTGQEIHFALNNKESVPVSPDIAFTASSTIKVPILVSFMLKNGAVVDDRMNTILLEVFQKSDNFATDDVMEELDQNQGPLFVTRDMETLGLENTFIGGFFYLGAPNLLGAHPTPANSRTDISTEPDPYTQTSPSDIGTLLSDIYQCAQTGGGALVAAFPTRANQQMCQTIINYMVQDKFGSLIQAGVPDGTLVAHKHGFVRDNFDVIHDISDAAIIYTPNGNFVLTIYTYHPINNLWDVTNPLVVKLTQAAYNYFNLPVR
jgi:beta-lactamase class A